MEKLPTEPMRLLENFILKLAVQETNAAQVKRHGTTIPTQSNVVFLVRTFLIHSPLFHNLPILTKDVVKPESTTVIL